MLGTLILCSALVFPCPTVPPTAGQPPPHQAGKPETRPDPRKGDPAATPPPVVLPYPAETPQEYRWVYAGQDVGSTIFQWRPVPPPEGADEAPALIEVRSRFRYSRDGRALRSETRSVLAAATLLPIRFRIEFTTFAEPSFLTSTLTEATFEDGVMRITRTQDKAETALDERAIPPRTYLFDAQCFEHWAILMPLLHREGPGKFSMTGPSQASVMEVELERVRSEEAGERKLWRWAARHSTFSGELWVTEEGQLVKYQQGELEILRVEKEKK